MTRQEAIELLDNLIGMIEDNHGADYDTALHMAIHSLKTDEAYQLEVDAVSRKAVINQIFYSTDNNGDVVLGSALRERIARLPSVTPQEPRWIPVSERLPEPNARDGLIARHYLIQNEYEDMLVASYDGKGWKQIYQHEYLKDKVIAWMPLPKRYFTETI